MDEIRALRVEVFQLVMLCERTKKPSRITKQNILFRMSGLKDEISRDLN